MTKRQFSLSAELAFFNWRVFTRLGIIGVGKWILAERRTSDEQKLIR
jgi:hypothetical protein